MDLLKKQHKLHDNDKKPQIERKGVKDREGEKETLLDLVKERTYLYKGVRGDLVVALPFITKSK